MIMSAFAQQSMEAVVSNGNLTVVGRQFNLPQFINLNLSQQGNVPDKLISDTVEAVFGAAKLDGADEATLEAMMRQLKLI